jgi:hypothetical protein
MTISTDQEEIDAMLFKLAVECTRPSWRFRAMFSERERQMIHFSVNTMMATRRNNQFMAELDRRYAPNRAGVGTQQAPHEQAPQRIV